MIYLDGIIFSLQARGGVSVYFDQLIQILEKRHLPHSLLLHEKELRYPAVKVTPPRLLERYRKVATPPSAKVLFSSYYRSPDNARLPFVTTVHDFVYEEFFSGPKRWLHSHQKFSAIQHASDIICVSEATRAGLYRHFGRPEGRVHVIPNGVSEDYYQLAAAEQHNGFLLYVGNRHAYKNFALLLKALPHLPELDLICVGGEPWTRAERKVTQLALKGELKVKRGVPSTELNQLYNEAVCLVYPSLYEGFGIPVIEAMLAGCPVVAVNCPAVKEAGGGALLVAENGQPGEVVEQICRCLSSERVTIVEAGLAQASQFSWSKTHAETTRILEEYL